MSTRNFVIWSVFVLFFLGTIGGLLLVSTTANANAKDNTMTIYLTERTVQTSVINQNPHYLSQGDRIIYSNNLFDTNGKIGHDSGYCDFVAVVPLNPEALCITTLVLGTSQLITSSLFASNDEVTHKPILYSVIGGTGKFLNARGVVKRIQIIATAQLTICLTWPQ